MDIAGIRLQPFRTCCGCCSLRAGAMIIASIELIVTLIMGILIILFIERWSTIAEDKKYYVNSTERAIFVADLILFLLYSVASMILLAGAIKRNKTMLKIWLVVGGVCMASQAGTSITQIARGDPGRGIPGVLQCAIRLLLWWVVYSFHRELKEGAQGTPMELTQKLQKTEI